MFLLLIVVFLSNRFTANFRHEQTNVRSCLGKPQKKLRGEGRVRAGPLRKKVWLKLIFDKEKRKKVPLRGGEALEARPLKKNLFCGFP